jgi:hypothetical protein
MVDCYKIHAIITFIYYAHSLLCMQVSVYISEQDFENLSKHRPPGKTTSQYMSAVLHGQAVVLSNPIATPSGTPIVPEYERQ